MTDTYIARMNDSIANLVHHAFRLSWHHPRYIFSFFKLARYQKQAARMRTSHQSAGLCVPAFMIVSVTRRCNLHCRGCYSHVAAANENATGRTAELNAAELERVIDEAADLGVSFVLLAGGEPLVRADDIIEMARRHPRMIFPIFTNGTLMGDKILDAFRQYRNLIPILSIEGGKSGTDNRRGTGVYERVMAGVRKLKRAGIFFGLSFTVTKGNVVELTSRDFVSRLVREDTAVFFYNEYTPIEAGTESLCITSNERENMLRDLQKRRAEFDRLFLAFPGDEERFGGCLSSGRGFIHVAPDGRVESCPFAPFGDSSTRDQSLESALRSPLLEQIRLHHDELEETSGGCALWNRREWVESLIPKKEEIELED